MANISIPHIFVASSNSRAQEVNDNYKAVIDGLSDGTKTITVNSTKCQNIYANTVTAEGLLTVSGTFQVAGSAHVKTFIVAENKFQPNIYSLGTPQSLTIGHVGGANTIAPSKNFAVITNNTTTATISTFTVNGNYLAVDANAGSPWVTIMAYPTAEAEIYYDHGAGTYTTLTTYQCLTFYCPAGVTSLYPMNKMYNRAL